MYKAILKEIIDEAKRVYFIALNPAECVLNNLKDYQVTAHTKTLLLKYGVPEERISAYSPLPHVKLSRKEEKEFRSIKDLAERELERMFKIMDKIPKQKELILFPYDTTKLEVLAVDSKKDIPELEKKADELGLIDKIVYDSSPFLKWVLTVH